MSSDRSDSKGSSPRKRGAKATMAESPRPESPRPESAAPPRFVEVTEQKRLNDAREAGIPWKKWGPYLSERQWGTVREDYSQDGNAWAYFSHDQSRSRAYRWGEDGLGGISDDKQRLCFALALWNGRDPILKERAFGLTNSEGNHGEDVKEVYFYVDATPTHSYMKYLYKYPQREFPYRDLIETNGRRSREELEYELIDTGVFDDNRYFDVFLEYAKAGPDDVLIRIIVHNRAEGAGPKPRGSICSRRSGFGTPGRGKRGRRNPASARMSAAAAARSAPRTRSWGITRSTATEPAPAHRSSSSRRMRATPSASGAGRTLLPGSRTRSTAMSSRGRAELSVRRRPARRLRPATSSTFPPVAPRSSACDCRPLPHPSRSVRASTQRSPRAWPTPMSSTIASRPPR